MRHVTHKVQNLSQILHFKRVDQKQKLLIKIPIIKNISLKVIIHTLTKAVKIRCRSKVNLKKIKQNHCQAFCMVLENLINLKEIIIRKKWSRKLLGIHIKLTVNNPRVINHKKQLEDGQVVLCSIDYLVSTLIFE